MSRSVYVPRDAMLVAYTSIEAEDELSFQMEVEELHDHILYTASDNWPSLYEPFQPTYYGREGRIVLQNRHVQLGYSFFFNLVAVWIIPRDECHPALAERWATQIAPRFHDAFGTLRHVGTASNGEAFYERKMV